MYDEVKDEINKIIHNNWTKAKEENSYGNNWEFTKYEIGKYLRKFSSNVAIKSKADENSYM